ERLLLDRVDAETRGAPVGGEHHLVVLSRAHEAEAALPFVELAVARAEVALNAAVVELVPPLAGGAHAIASGSPNVSAVKRRSFVPSAQPFGRPAFCR